MGIDITSHLTYVQLSLLISMSNANDKTNTP